MTTQAHRTVWMAYRRGPRIQRIPGEGLDKLLLPAITGGTMSTRYNPANGATEYRDAGRLLAVTVGSHHFAEVLS